jgi:hypothetical protein
MNQYRAIDAAYEAIVRHPPLWLSTLAPAPDQHQDGGGRLLTEREQLDQIVAVINSDRPTDTADSDDMLRRLIAIGRYDSDAITVILRAFIPRLRARIRSHALAEYHSDAIAALSMVCLDSNLDGPNLAMRLLNRAHNRTWRDGRRFRNRGEINHYRTNPLSPDVILEAHERVNDPAADPADHVARIVDLARFSQAVHAALDSGEISVKTWEHFRDLKLARALLGGEALSATRRTEAFRAAKRMEHLIDNLLSSHAA